MKTFILNSIFAVGILIIVGCNDDFLDRTPLSALSPANSFNSAQDLELYTNSFYNDLPGEEIIQIDNLSDDILYNTIPFEQTGERLVPSSAGSSGWDWGTLRKINIFFDNYQRCTDEVAKKEYSGVAYFFRALFYYDKIKRFGDVPWYDNVIGSADVASLKKPRDSRVLVVEKMIADLDNAISTLNSKQSPDRINKWTALALKSRICLFEGTFRKYHTNLNLPDADKLLTLAAEAAQQVIKEGPFSLYSTGNKLADYRDLFVAEDAIKQEIMLTRRYNKDLNQINNINYYFIIPALKQSLTKSIINEYLMKDGSRFTEIAGYDTLPFYKETQNRDPRLAQTIRTPGYTRIGGTSVLVPNLTEVMSGYHIAKFVADASQDGFKTGHQDVSIIRYAEVLLNFAEAKAELGTLSQSDVDASINLLRNRVGMPQLNLSNANANPDTYLQAKYPNVSGTNSGIILEIRRERRIELVLEGFRYDDVMRWKCGKLLEQRFMGMYFPKLGAFDLDNNGSLDVEVYTGTASTSAPQKVEIGGTSVMSLTQGTYGNLVPFVSRTKLFNEDRDYLYPIPTGDIVLNANLIQNPNW